MAIPDFQSLMLPLLRQLADGAQHRAADVVAALAGEFRLSPEEMAEQLPSGRANKFANRAVKAVLPFSPVVGMVSTCLLVAAAVGQCSTAILNAGWSLQVCRVVCVG